MLIISPLNITPEELKKLDIGQLKKIYTATNGIIPNYKDGMATNEKGQKQFYSEKDRILSSLLTHLKFGRQLKHYVDNSKVQELKEAIRKQVIKEMENISAVSSTTQENKAEDKMDPLDDILTKYPTLVKALSTLLSDHFKEYLNGVYIIAPKPTTFKIVLHNDQEFYLEYTGRTYEAKVNGRRYYLLNIGEEQQATKAIANLLSLGKPKENLPPTEEVETTSAQEKNGGKSEKKVGGRGKGRPRNPDYEERQAEKGNEVEPEGGDEVPGEEEKDKKQIQEHIIRIVEDEKIEESPTPKRMEELQNLMGDISSEIMKLTDMNTRYYNMMIHKYGPKIKPDDKDKRWASYFDRVKDIKDLRIQREKYREEYNS